MKLLRSQPSPSYAKGTFYILIAVFSFHSVFSVSAREFHVAKTGNDNQPGTVESPVLTIQEAANRAMPGDIVIIHGGIYREKIIPPRAGESGNNRIVFTAAKNEKVEIKGSEIIKNWEIFSGSVWKVKIPNGFFYDYNPYKDLVHGDWFNDLGRIHHTGEVYLNGKSLWEMEILEKVLNPLAVTGSQDAEGSTFTWYCESDDNYTYIYANFHGFDPNVESVEINVRNSCFYPEKTGINYITVKGMHLSQAATQWAPPTAEQIGLIGTNWSKGWVIENNVISDSKCSGITLGKHGDKWDNTSENSAEGYVETIKRALANGWSKENIGHHIIRNNRIFNCGQTGICGSMGGVFSRIENNDIFDIWTKRQWTGAEMGGIKIHASIDMVIKNNRLANCGRGLWLDWMAQGTRVTGNLLYNNTTDDLFVEVNHGPFLIENNILLSELAIRDWSEGGAYVHNLIAGNIEIRPQKRITPYQVPHGTEIGGMAKTRCGDNRFFNNIFAGGVTGDKIRKSGLGAYRNAELPMFIDGNVYLNNASVPRMEKNQIVISGDPGIKLAESPDGIFLSIYFDEKILTMKNRTVTSEWLGKTAVSGLRFENHDGTAINIDKDYFGKPRNQENPTPGPFEKPKAGKIKVKIK